MSEEMTQASQVSTAEGYRAATTQLKERMIECGGVVGEEADQLLPLKHQFGDGCYVRELSAPAGIFAVTKIHKKAHPFFLMKGEVTVLTEDGSQRITAPYYGMTPAGTQRVVYTHSETQWGTVHATELTDLDEIENQIIAKTFDELEISEPEATKIEESE